MNKTILITRKQIYNKCCKNQKLKYVNDNLLECSICFTIYSLDELRQLKNTNNADFFKE